MARGSWLCVAALGVGLRALLASASAGAVVPSQWAAQKALWQVRGTAKQIVPVTGQSFPEAVRLSVRTAPAHEWDVQARLPTQVSVEQGQTLLISFHARVVGGKAGLMAVLFQQASDPYTTSFSKVVELSDRWQAYVVAGKSGSGFSPGAANLLFHVGAQAQTVEIGGLSVDIPEPSVAAPPSAAPDQAASGRRSYFDLLRLDIGAVGRGRFIAPETEAAVMKKLSCRATRVQDFTVEGLPFTLARRAVCKERTKDFWGANLAIHNLAPVRKGETVYLTFFIRAGQAPEVSAKGPIHIDAHLKQRTPFYLIAQRVTDVGDRWTRCQIAGRVDRDYPADALEAIICFGHKAQVIEVGGVALAAFAAEVDMRRVPGSACNAKH